MKTLKVILVALTAGIVLMFGGIDITANTTQDFSESSVQYMINPIYDGLVPVFTQDSPLKAYSYETTAYRPTFYNISEAAAYVRGQMKSRNKTIEFYYHGGEGILTILDKAVEHTGVPNEGDNLAHEWSSCSYIDSSFGANYYGLYFEYLTTVEQERELCEKITAVLASLNLEDKTDFEKIEAIHDWICFNVIYDYASLNNEPGQTPLCGLAYAAMMYGKAVCDGYALLCYRMMLEAGIECRYINGMTPGGGHAWNIVKLDGQFYAIDTTWDALPDLDYLPEPPAGSYYIYSINYNYFLKGSANFTDHVPGEKYSSDDFKKQYPLSESDYTGHHIHNISIDYSTSISPTCTESGYAGDIICSQCGRFFNKGMTIKPYGHSYNSSGLCILCGAEKPPYTPGDVNDDGEVTLEDAIMTLKKVMNVDLGNTTFITEAAEVTGDNHLTLEDAIGVLKLAMKVTS